jgi:hypothetical protein
METTPQTDTDLAAYLARQERIIEQLTSHVAHEATVHAALQRILEEQLKQNAALVTLLKQVIQGQRRGQEA